MKMKSQVLCHYGTLCDIPERGDYITEEDNPPDTEIVEEELYEKKQPQYV